MLMMHEKRFLVYLILYFIVYICFNELSSLFKVCIVGSCEELGCWDPCRILPLVRVVPSAALVKSISEELEPPTWTVSMQLPVTKVHTTMSNNDT